ncbi:MAG: efflux RND transporter periplasmic adaptor subunit [Leptolyngbyaceae cyanobacterium bins.59]|nr:efflux RND transporter periplasmic adaptor subunit [Leptolyngbyaceae cyanobacterium bins.59]
MKIPLMGVGANKTRWLLGTVLGVTIAGTVAVALSQRSADRPRRQSQTLETVPVETEDLRVRIRTSGTVTPVQEVNVSPKTQGRLAELFVEQGDRVQKGQLLARMENIEVQARLDEARASLAQAEARLAELRNGTRPEEIAQAEARLAQAEARLAQTRRGTRFEEVAQAQAQVDAARSQLTLAQDRSQRYRGLAQQGAISQDQLDEVLTNERNAEAGLRQAQRRFDQLRNGSRPEEVAQAEATTIEARQVVRQLRNGTRPEQITQAEAQVAQAEAQMRAVESQVADTEIRAPFTGIVTQKYANVGSFVTPTTAASSTSSATSTSIVAIAGQVEVLAKVSEADIAQLKVGQKVEISTVAFPGQTFRGQVRLIAPTAVVEQNVTSFQTRITLQSGQKQLRSGMNVDLTFIGQPIKSALVVPTVAIVTQRGKTGVFVPGRDQQPEFRPVVIGLSVGDQTQIVKGVKAGEPIVVYNPQPREPRRERPPVRF